MGLEFEKQPRESAKAFAAFSEYLNMGAGRSLGAVAQRLHKSVTMLGRWSRKYDWPARVQAHGAHLALVERQATEAALKSKAAEWLQRQCDQRDVEWALRCELIEAGREALRRWRADARRCGSLEGIARMIELASKLGRLASGMATDHTEVTGEISVTLDVEWELALKKVYGRRPGAVVDAEVVTEQGAGARKRESGVSEQGLLTSAATEEKR